MGLFTRMCRSNTRLDGKTAIVTGSNTGLGQYTCQDFFKRGCRVIMACRNLEKANKAKEEILERTKGVNNVGELIIAELDLASLQSVRSFANQILQEESKINILVNNAGVICPKSFTADGFEMIFGVNHLGHFLLTILLLPRILQSSPSRIINVTSLAHNAAGKIDWENLNCEKSYSFSNAYCTSKLCNILFTKHLAKLLEGKHVTTYAVNPGFVKTNMSRHADSILFPGATWLYYNILGLFHKTVKQGAQGIIHCAVDEEAGKVSGLYYSDSQPVSASSSASDPHLAEELWDHSLKLVKIENQDSLLNEHLAY